MSSTPESIEPIETTEISAIPLLPLRDIVVFPRMVVPLFVGRDGSIAALDAAVDGDRAILLCAQRDPAVNEPGPDDLYEVGTRGTVIQHIKLPDGTIKVLVEGRERVRVTEVAAEGPLLRARSTDIERAETTTVEVEALMRSIKVAFESYMKLNKRIPPEMLLSVRSVEDPAQLSDAVAAHLSVKLEDKQALLAEPSAAARCERLLKLMQSEIEILQVERRIRSRVKRQMDRNQKEHYLQEQMHAIQQELGEEDELQSELAELKARIARKRLSDEARDKLRREVRKLKMMAPMSPEATVVRHYIDWVLDLPWDQKTDAQTDLDQAEATLEEDHYGLTKVKERILEHLAVQALTERMRGPVLCFVGPPGVGKTSLGRSIARATGRRFVRISLGGVRDEAEIRGHRRTYIGALPGKIIQQMKKAGSQNPVFLLDEVDKMSTDFRGDPSAALLEVLDPEQNHAFCDHYLDLDYDLSDVMFITTANSLEAIPLPLQDRMEVIRLEGYTEEEKLAIARRYLVPRQQELSGLGGCELTVSDPALRTIIHSYTREAGVRSLEREVAAVCRKIAKEVVRQTHPPTFRIGTSSVLRLLGPPRFHQNERTETDEVGLACGLAVTRTGGELLPTEVAVMPGRGKLVLTGKLGDVMQESAQAALSYVRSRALSLGLDPHFNQRVDLHVHFPEGAIPKDGPSAGITMATAVVSALTHLPVKGDLAMTGEITLRGRVLAVGGIKDKLLAARRTGVRTVIIPADNVKDLAEVPAQVRKSLQIEPVDHMDQVLHLALRMDDAEALLPAPSEVLDWRMVEPPPSPTAH